MKRTRSEYGRGNQSSTINYITVLTTSKNTVFRLRVGKSGRNFFFGFGERILKYVCIASLLAANPMKTFLQLGARQSYFQSLPELMTQSLFLVTSKLGRLVLFPLTNVRKCMISPSRIRDTHRFNSKRISISTGIVHVDPI